MSYEHSDYRNDADSSRYICAKMFTMYRNKIRLVTKIPAGVSGFFIDIKSFRSPSGLGVDSSASNTNEYQEYFLRVQTASA
jgi:hypothetical protein